MSPTGRDDLLRAVQSHLDWFIDHVPARGYGPDDSAMWVSSLSLETGRHPVTARPRGIEKRCYRWIESPFGSNAYWDGPLFVAAIAASDATGDPGYADAANAAVTDFLHRCVAENGLFLWGNHYYYDVLLGTVVAFRGNEEPKPVDFATESGAYHETRPLRVPWSVFRAVDALATRKSILAQLDRHTVDPATGEFNRHADKRRGHAFLEAGAILAETACDEASVAGDDSLVERALAIARFSAAEKGHRTGLLRNSPTFDRWDMHTSTSELGMWAGSMLRCADTTGRGEFADLGAAALHAWLEYAWDESAERYFGRLRVDDGTADTSPKTTQYQPGTYSDPWEPLFPIHDYPMPCAEACLDYSLRTGDPAFRTGVERWVSVVATSLPARGGRGSYAEHYGRCIRFLDRAAREMGRSDWREISDAVTAEAMAYLRVDGLFRTHPGEDRCDAVDGLGFLLLALLSHSGVASPSRVTEPF